MKRIYAVSALLILCNPAFAAEASWFTTIQGGFGAQYVTEEPYLVGDYTGNEDYDLTFELLVSGGYQFSSGLRPEILIKSASELFLVYDTDDGYSRTEIQGLLGYSFIVSSRFCVTPKIGISNWRLKYTEPDGPDFHFSGSDIVTGIDLGFATNKLVTINLSFNYGDYDFGKVRYVSTGVRFNF